MELDGLASNATPLGKAAKTAIAFVARARRLAQSPNLERQLSLTHNISFFFHHIHVLLLNAILMICLCCILYCGKAQACARCRRRRARCETRHDALSEVAERGHARERSGNSRGWVSGRSGKTAPGYRHSKFGDRGNKNLT
jgi:hypothetical protein